jgi:hypothetical protein
MKQAVERISAHVQELIAEGKKLLYVPRSQAPQRQPGLGPMPSYGPLPSDPFVVKPDDYIGRALDSISKVDYQGWTRWTAKCRNLAHVLGESAEPWWTDLTGPCLNTQEQARGLIGTLEAIADLLKEGLLIRAEDLVMAEVFASLLEQADYLLSEGYHLAAGVLGRAVLEEHLRKWCRREECTPTTG